MEAGFTESEIKIWFQKCLKNENLKDMKVSIKGFSEKDDGYLSDIVFVQANGKVDGKLQVYNLAVKCSKKHTGLSPTQKLFFNEIHIYDVVIPTFTQFQLERGIKKPFNNIPKYYGHFISENQEVIVLENLAHSGYSLWDRKKPLPRSHIQMILEQYAKFHAISIALQDQCIEKWNQLAKPIEDNFKDFSKIGQEFARNLGNTIKVTCELFKDDIEAEVLLKWKHFGETGPEQFLEMVEDFKGNKVITHGDGWNNNFMFQGKNGDINNPINVSILDWQIATLGSVARDLSYFLFTSISKDDIKDTDIFLDEYYHHFSNYLISLRSDPVIYSKNTFLEEWKLYSKFGILIAATTMKFCTIEKEDAPDVSLAVENGDFGNAFKVDIKNECLFKDRMKPVVEYVVEHGLI